MEIIKCKEAYRLGLKFYFTGKPCPYGHIIERYVTNHGCYRCLKLNLVKRRKDDPEGQKLKRKLYAITKPEIIRLQKQKTRERHLEKYKAKQCKYWRDRPEYKKMICARYRARKREASGHHTVKELKSLLEKQKHKCMNCLVQLSKTGYNADHIIPLAKGGSNNISNIQILCPSCNYRKRAKDPIRFAREEGRLL